MTPSTSPIRLQGNNGKGKRCRITSLPEGGRKVGKGRLRKRNTKKLSSIYILNKQGERN